MAQRRVWLALADPLTSKLFYTSGLVPGLRERLGDRLELVFLMSREQAAEWEDDARGIAVAYRDELFPNDVQLTEKAVRRIDAERRGPGSARPLAIRFNERYAFHRSGRRMGTATHSSISTTATRCLAGLRRVRAPTLVLQPAAVRATSAAHSHA